MATVQISEIAVKGEGLIKDFNIVDLVNEATWKDLLIELVHKNMLDPWNIDIIDIVDKYVNAVKAMKVLDLRVPANIILAASILLRMKSEMLSINEPEEEEATEEVVHREVLEPESLTFRLRIPPKRRVTLNELISALDEAMKLKEYKETSKRESNNITIPITINRFDIGAETRKLYKEIKGIVDKDKMITFTALHNHVKVDDVLLELFIPLLFLASQNKISLIQEQFFSEIIVALN